MSKFEVVYIIQSRLHQLNPFYLPLFKLDKSIRIDFISLFKKSVYGNTYIYNLIDYFSRHIYPYFMSGIYINNVIILFNHYLQANLKLYTIYIDANLYFISQELRMYF